MGGHKVHSKNLSTKQEKHPSYFFCNPPPPSLNIKKLIQSEPPWTVVASTDASCISHFNSVVNKKRSQQGWTRPSLLTTSFVVHFTLHVLPGVTLVSLKPLSIPHVSLSLLVIFFWNFYNVTLIEWSLPWNLGWISSLKFLMWSIHVGSFALLLPRTNNILFSIFKQRGEETRWKKNID